MNKDELIVKQQLEIENLKAVIQNHKEAQSDALNHLIFVQQWSPKCSDFPSVAMKGVVSAAKVLQGR